jgi:hypothetical protein
MIQKHQGEPKDCDCEVLSDLLGLTYLVDADKVYSDKDKEEMIQEEITWDFQFELCSECDGIVGILG